MRGRSAKLPPHLDYAAQARRDVDKTLRSVIRRLEAAIESGEVRSEIRNRLLMELAAYRAEAKRRGL